MMRFTDFGRGHKVFGLGLALIFVVGLLALGGSSALANHPGAGGVTLHAELNGANEIMDGEPNGGDPDGSGTATIRLNQGQGEVCFELEVADIAPATAAHIHAAPAGVNGGVVVGLAAPTGGSSSGCIQGVGKDLIKAIRQNPANYYVNVHNTDFPGGALRGQLSK